MPQHDFLIYTDKRLNYSIFILGNKIYLPVGGNMLKSVPQSVIVMVGIALIGIGLYRITLGHGPSAQDRILCKQRMTEQHGTANQDDLNFLLSSCADAGTIAMMKAQAAGNDAQATAEAIGTANNAEGMTDAISWGMIGIGIPLVISAFAGRRKKKAKT